MPECINQLLWKNNSDDPRNIWHETYARFCYGCVFHHLYSYIIYHTYLSYFILPIFLSSSGSFCYIPLPQCIWSKFGVHLTSMDWLKSQHYEVSTCLLKCGIKLLIPVRMKFHDDVIKWKHFPRYWPLYMEFSGAGEFPAQRSVAQSFDVFFGLRLNKRLSKQWWGLWFETP